MLAMELSHSIYNLGKKEYSTRVLLDNGNALHEMEHC